MLRTIAVVLVLVWALGWATSSALGGFIHMLVVLALVLLLIQAHQAARASQRDAEGGVNRREPGDQEALTVWEGEGGTVPAAAGGDWSLSRSTGAMKGQAPI